MNDFGKIEKASLRETWQHEAHDFTPWLAENIKSLGKALGFDLEIIGREDPVGDFWLDLLAQDVNSQKKVIIENQLSQTNHDHLGKLITYASGLNASIVIWVAEFIREEHIRALDWLNQRTDTEIQFFAIELEVLKIGDSQPAVNFKPVVTPNGWKKKRKSMSSRITTSSKYAGKTTRVSKYAGKTIRALVNRNPRRSRTYGHRSFQIVLDNGGLITFEEYKSKGGRNNDLAWDIDHEYVSIE